MPQVVAGAALSAAVSSITAGAFTLAAFATSFAGSLVLGGLSYALTPKPKKPNSPPAPGSTVSVRQSDLTRQIVYGHTRITSGYAHMVSTGANGTLHIILMLCEGQLRAINEIWVNDYCIPPDWIDADGNITEGRYKNFMTVRKHLGAPDQAADTMAVANLANWTTAHRLQGIAYLYITLTNDQDVYPTGVPNISAIVEGAALYDPRVSTNRWTTNIAIYANDFLLNPTYGFGALSEDIDAVNTSAQANICDEIVTVVNEDAMISLVTPSTDIITLQADLLKLQYGDRVEIVTDGTPPGGLAVATSYYVIPFQILTKPRVKLATTLDNAMAGTAIDITDAGSGSMTLRKTGEPRYHGSGVIDTDTNLTETLNNIVSSMAGRAVNIGGYWTLLAGAWRTPALSLGIGDMRGNGIAFKNDLSMADSFNIVKGLFVSSLNLYQNSDYPSANFPQFVSDDNNLESIKEINLYFTNRPTTAQRIAKIELFRGRQGIAVTSGFSTKALQVQPGDNVELGVNRLGWEDKEFEVTSFSFDVSDNTLVTNLNLRETSESIFNWTGGEAILFDPAPNTNLPNPFDVLVPTGVQYNSRSVTTVASDELYIVQLEWLQHPDAFVREFGDFEIQFKLSSDIEWLPSFFVDGSLTETDVFTASIGIEYDIRIRARNNLGVRSGWSTLFGILVGSSGGVTINYDWDFVYNPVTTNLDWGNVFDAPSVFNDWGFVV